MLPRIKQIGKIATSGVLFTFLGVGGCLLSLFVLPVLARIPASGKELPRQRMERVIRACFRLFVYGLELSTILKVEAVGFPDPEDLAGTIIVANHPSYLDIVVLIALLPRAVCVVKEAVWNNFFFGGLVRYAGFISNQDPEAVLDNCREALATGRILVVFPEGSRTRPGQPLKFHRGAAHLALRTGAPLRPFTITVTPPLLAKGDRWYHVPVATCRFRITAGPALESAHPAADDPLFTSGARTLTRAMEAHYCHELQATGQSQA